MPNPANPRPPLPFEEVTEASFSTDFLKQNLEQTPTPGGGIRISGDCPRCQDGITTSVIPDVVKSMTTPAPVLPSQAANSQPPSSATVPAAKLDHTVVCNCQGDRHPGRPASIKDGCGAYWLIATRKREAS